MSPLPAIMPESKPALLLIDIGNTHTHLGLARGERITRQTNLRTPDWSEAHGAARLARFLRETPLAGAALCSVVPRATPLVRATLRRLRTVDCRVLTHRNVTGLGIDYPRPATIGPDRLANALAARDEFGAPVLVVDFGTAVTFDVVNRRGDYIGGIIAPGLAAMTDYLHEKTALLPRITIREPRSVIGRSTREAMLVGAVHGYRGLVRELVVELKRELGARELPIAATGGYAGLIAAKLPEITAVRPLLTLDGLRRFWSGAPE